MSISVIMGRKHREKKMSDKEAEENLTAKLVETGYREELKKKVRDDPWILLPFVDPFKMKIGCQISFFPLRGFSTSI